MDLLPKTGLYSHDVTAYLLAAEELDIQPNQEFLSILVEAKPECSLDGVDDINLEAISKILKVNAFIKKLRFTNGTFTVVGLTHLADALGGNETITEIDLSDFALGDAGAKIIGDQIGIKELTGGGCRSLQSLNVSGCGLGPAGLEALCRGLGGLPGSARVLRAERNHLPPQAGLAVGKAVRSRPGLAACHLAGNALGDIGAAAVGGALAADTRKAGKGSGAFRLHTLDLAGNGLGCEGLQALLRGLSTLASLRRAAHHDEVGPGGGAPCPPCPLRVLRLQDNVIADSGAGHLADILRQSGDFRIEELDLSGNNIGSDGISALCSALANNPPLTNLNLSGCNLDPDGTGLRAVASMLVANKNLQYLNISPGEKVQRALADPGGALAGLAGAFADLAGALDRHPALRALELGRLRLVLGRHPGLLERVEARLQANRSLGRLAQAQAQASGGQGGVGEGEGQGQAPAPPAPAAAAPAPAPAPSAHAPAPAHKVTEYKLPPTPTLLGGDISAAAAAAPFTQQWDSGSGGGGGRGAMDSSHQEDQLVQMQREHQAVLSQLTAQLALLLPQKGAQGSKTEDLSSTLDAGSLVQTNLQAIKNHLGTPSPLPQMATQTASHHTANEASTNHLMPVLEPIPSPDQVKRIAEAAAEQAVEKVYERHLRAAEALVAREVEGLRAAARKADQERRWAEEEGARARAELAAAAAELGSDLKARLDRHARDHRELLERLEKVEKIVGLNARDSGQIFGKCDLETLHSRTNKIEQSVEKLEDKTREIAKEGSLQQKHFLDDLKATGTGVERLGKAAAGVERRLAQLEASCVQEHEANLKVLEALLEAAQQKK